MVHVVINGDRRELPDGSSVLDMLAQYKLEQKILVVELNRTIIDRSVYEATSLSEGDQVEIVHFVGGG